MNIGRVNRVTAIKTAIVIAAGIGTAVILIVLGGQLFGFEWVVRGEPFEFPLSWFGLAWMVLPNLVLAFFVGRWWRGQDCRLEAESIRPRITPWLAGYVVVTSIALVYYLRTFTTALT